MTATVEHMSHCKEAAWGPAKPAQRAWMSATVNITYICICKGSQNRCDPNKSFQNRSNTATLNLQM
jgi:hypothetical protein